MPKHLTENDLPAIEALTNGVTIQATPPETGALWWDSDRARLMVRHNNTFRRADGGAFYPDHVRCDRVEAYSGKQTLSRTRYKSGKLHNSIAYI